MKTNHLNKLLLTSLVLVAVTGCGKDEKKSAAAPVPPPAPAVAAVAAPVVINNTAATGQQALTNLQTWYGSTTENSVPSMLAKSVKLGVSIANQNNCKDKSYLGGFINIQTCFSASVNTTTFTTSFVTAVSNGAVKSGNAKLASAVSAASGLVMLNVSQTPGNFGHPLYTVDYGKANGHTVRYKIDSGLNSAFNPVETYDTELGRLEYVANPSELRQ